eukprot:13869559-Alexandrium_andersonii.AAC.1
MWHDPSYHDLVVDIVARHVEAQTAGVCKECEEPTVDANGMCGDVPWAPMTTQICRAQGLVGLVLAMFAELGIRAGANLC